MTFTISPEQFAQFQKKLAVLNRRAAKCGTEPLVITRQAETVVKIDGKFCPAVEFDLDGQVPSIGDFELLATVTHTAAGNIISKAPAARQLDLEEYRAAGSGECDHCNKVRRRNDTFILRDTDGTLVRVGRNCLADFLRCPDVDNAVWRMSLLSELGDMADEFGSSGGGSSYICIDEYLACAVASTRRNGFRKTDSENSTRKDVAYLINGPGRNATSEALRDWLAARPLEADRQLAKAVRAWGKVQGGTEFGVNLSVACRLDYVLPKTGGLLAAAPYCFDATMAPARAGYRPFSDAWLGVTGERLRELKIKVIKAHCANTRFGVSTFYTMQDLGSGCCLSWKASGEPLGTETGREFILDGTVKTHDTFRETKKTILTRCSIHLAKESTKNNE